ncbi:MAG: flagellar hook-length control protein FliK [Clostridia bacterium]|nr:flagellar hook-length control protein FliK [Clostridia bacterium]
MIFGDSILRLQGLASLLPNSKETQSEKNTDFTNLFENLKESDAKNKTESTDGSVNVLAQMLAGICFQSAANNLSIDGEQSAAILGDVQGVSQINEEQDTMGNFLTAAEKQDFEEVNQILSDQILSNPNSVSDKNSVQLVEVQSISSQNGKEASKQILVGAAEPIEEHTLFADTENSVKAGQVHVNVTKFTDESTLFADMTKPSQEPQMPNNSVLQVQQFSEGYKGPEEKQILQGVQTEFDNKGYIKGYDLEQTAQMSEQSTAFTFDSQSYGVISQIKKTLQTDSVQKSESIEPSFQESEVSADEVLLKQAEVLNADASHFSLQVDNAKKAFSTENVERTSKIVTDGEEEAKGTIENTSTFEPLEDVGQTALDFQMEMGETSTQTNSDESGSNGFSNKKDVKTIGHRVDGLSATIEKTGNFSLHGLSDVSDSVQSIKTAVEDAILKSSYSADEFGNKEMEIQLKPDNLGKILIKLQSAGGVMNIKIVATDPDVKDIIVSQVSQIETSIREQGISLREIDVAYSGDSLAQHFGNSGYQESDKRHTYRGVGTYDEYISDNEEDEFSSLFYNSSVEFIV